MYKYDKMTSILKSEETELDLTKKLLKLEIEGNNRLLERQNDYDKMKRISNEDREDLIKEIIRLELKNKNIEDSYFRLLKSKRGV